jgi:hypothetical protein
MGFVIKCVGFLVVLTVTLGTTLPGFAQAPEPSSSVSEKLGSVIVFPKFIKGTVTVDGVTRPQTEIAIRAGCPSSATCSEDEPVKIRFHWVCPGSQDLAPKYVCKESDFEVRVTVDGKTSLNPEDPQLVGINPGSIAPCPRGYLIGWVINPITNRPIKYDALSGSAILRNRGGAIESYEAFAIQADPNLATRADIATDIDPRTGAPTLVFDGRAGHYQAVARAVPENLEYRKLTGHLSSNEVFLILLTLDVRVNRPNYPTVIDLDSRMDRGLRPSPSWNFVCWTEIQYPDIGANFALDGARTPNGVVLSGRAVKEPVGGISDIPGPVTLLGLVPSEENRGHLSMDPAYIVNRFDNNRPTTVFLPFH